MLGESNDKKVQVMESFHDLVADMDINKNETMEHEMNNDLNQCLTLIVLLIWAFVLYISYNKFNDVLR